MDTFRTTLVFIILFLSKGESGQCNEGTTLTRGWGFNASSAWDHGPCGGEPEAAAYETVGRQLVVQGETRRLKSRVAVDFQPTWHVLGPLALTFLGSPADVLSAFVDDTEHYLSQRNLTDHFPSEIAEGGYAIWQALMANRTNPMAPWLLEASFPINADLLASFYGITGIEFGAIAVTEIRVPQAGIYRFSEPNAPRTFVVDGRMQRHDPFMGNDSFGYHLEAGKRLFWVPVTEYGNSISLRIPRLQIVDPTPAVLVLGDVLMPDIVGGKLTSPFWSMTIMPTTPLLPGDLRISGSLRYSLSKAPIAFDAKGSEGVAALQPWPLKMSVAVPEDVVISLCSEDQLLLQVYIRDTLAVSTSYRLRCRNFSEPYRFTFEDFDGSVQYAAMWSPRTKSCPKTGCAVLMSFHGAGVEADSYAWTSSYRQQEDAWILLPTNRRQYGYDWATTGAQNAWSALAWLGKYQPGVPLNLKAHVFADTTRILYAGHSMGGHGCLVASTHFPDFGLGLVPASGWLRHSTYLPDYLIPDFSHLDHVARGILENSIADTDADAHASNVVGLPALIRVGTVDETVPSQNLRRFFRILRSFSRLYKSTAEVTLSEIAGEGHWFGGIVDDEEIQAFLERTLSRPSSFEPPRRPPLPATFVLTTLHPSSSGSRGGIRIIQTEKTGRVARIRVSIAGGFWTLQTENVALFNLTRIDGLPFPQMLVVNGVHIPAREGYLTGSTARAFQPLASADTEWTVWERSPSNYGPARQIFETAPVKIVYSRFSYDRARMVATDMFSRGRWAVELVEEAGWVPDLASKNNLVLLGGPWENKATAWLVREVHERVFERNLGSDQDILVHWNASSVGFRIGSKSFSGPHHGVLFLAPQSLSDPARLALVVAGNSPRAFEHMARFIPTFSAARVPDYLVCDASHAWQGYGSCEMGGFWSSRWGFDSASAYGG